MQASFWLQLEHDRTAKLMKVNSDFFLPCFVTENPSEHDQAIKRALVVSNKTFENALGWLTRVLCGWSSSGSSWCDCGFAGMVGVGFKRRERVCGGGGVSWGGLVEEDAALNGLAADGAFAHSVPTQLAGAVAAHEDHVLQPIQTHRTHRLFFDVLELLL